MQEKPILGASSGLGAQGSVLKAFFSSAPSTMKDTETKSILGTTVDSKRPIFKYWGKKKSFHQSSFKLAACLIPASAKIQNTACLQRVGLDGILGRNCKGCPEQIWLPLHPWKRPRPSRTGLGAACAGGRCPCPWDKVPSNSNSSVIYDEIWCFLKPVNLFLLSHVRTRRGWWQNSLVIPSSAAGVQFMPLCRGCSLRLGCERRITKSKFRTEAEALHSVAAQKSLPYL